MINQHEGSDRQNPQRRIFLCFGESNQYLVAAETFAQQIELLFVYNAGGKECWTEFQRLSYNGSSRQADWPGRLYAAGATNELRRKISWIFLNNFFSCLAPISRDTVRQNI